MIATLPKPPSVNHMYGYRCFRGIVMVYITKKGREWFTNAGILLREQWHLKEPINVPIAITINLYTARFQDLDGILKCSFDVMQRCVYCGKHRCVHNLRSITNDHIVQELHVYSHKVKHITEEKITMELQIMNKKEA